MKLFESRQIKRLTEAKTSEELQPIADKIKSSLGKIVDPKKHGLGITVRKIMGDFSITINFSKFREEDKMWTSGIWMNDPALLQIHVDTNPNGSITAEAFGHTRYLNYKRAGVGNMIKKTGTLPQVIKHLENYFTKTIQNIDNENFN